MLLSHDKPVISLGDLLISSGMMRAEEVREAVEVSKALALSPVKVFVWSGSITKPDLDAAFEAHRLIEAGNLAIETAVEALKLVACSGLSLDRALNRLLSPPDQQKEGTIIKLGELLLIAGLVSRNQLARALEIAGEAKRRLGDILVQGGHLSDVVRGVAVNLQDQVNRRRIGAAEAAEALSQLDRKMHRFGLLLN